MLHSRERTEETEPFEGFPFSRCAWHSPKFSTSVEYHWPSPAEPAQWCKSQGRLAQPEARSLDAGSLWHVLPPKRKLNLQTGPKGMWKSASSSRWLLKQRRNSFTSLDMHSSWDTCSRGCYLAAKFEGLPDARATPLRSAAHARPGVTNQRRHRGPSG